MKKIGVVNLRFYPALGGAETLILEICKRLTNKFDITIITSDIKTELPYKKLAETEMIDEYQTLKIERLTSKHLLPLEGYGNVLRGLKKELKNFDIIHTYGYGYYHTDRSIRVAKKFNIPSVFTPLLHKAFFAKHKFLRSIYDSTRGKRTLELANRIIGLSNEEKKYLSKRFGIREDKITVVPCGVDLEKFKDLGKEKENELLFVGRLSPVKSLEILVKALAIVKKIFPI